MRAAELVTIWRRSIGDGAKSWVLFGHGTCVVLPNPEPDADLAAMAIEILRAYGPVHPGSPAGDFGTIPLEPGPGWLVWCHHGDIMTYVDPGEVERTDDLSVGLWGRSKRDWDAHELEVIHVEDRRAA
ncbi:hypothetical protein ACFFWC_23980 [Plantactinospora siamensis]|uniref:Uncharacterized protein n=1 Tax=Plantactinospora siamensis TaxID=555372 RepID=A0ABV6P540_9ACTN